MGSRRRRGCAVIGPETLPRPAAAPAGRWMPTGHRRSNAQQPTRPVVCAGLAPPRGGGGEGCFGSAAGRLARWRRAWPATLQQRGNTCRSVHFLQTPHLLAEFVPLTVRQVFTPIFFFFFPFFSYPEYILSSLVPLSPLSSILVTVTTPLTEIVGDRDQ